MEGAAPTSSAPSAAQSAPNASQPGAFGSTQPAAPKPQGSNVPAPKEAKAPGEPDVSKYEGSTPKDDTPEAKAAEKKKYKVKTSDFEGEVDEDEVVRGYQRAREANKRFEEVARREKELARKEWLFQNHPEKALEIYGHNIRDFSERQLKSVIEEEMLPPEEKIRKQAEKEKAELAEKLAKYEEAEKKKAFEAQKQHFSKQIEAKFMQALEHSDLPKDAFTVKQLAEYERKARAAKIDMTPAELADLVREDMTNGYKSLTQKMSGSQLLKFLGEETLQKIREADVKRVRGENSFTPPTPVVVKPAEPGTKDLTWDQWKELRKKQIGV